VHSIWLLQNKTITQQQKKIAKHLETENYIAILPIGHQRNKGIRQKVPGT
jgi:hypothetical protein